jgi:hypothetical protein
VKRLPLIITLVFAGALVGLYVYYTTYHNKPSFKAWDLIPDKAILVYEPGNCSACEDQAAQTPLWELARKTSSRARTADLFQEINDAMQKMDFALVSLHTIKKDDFDLIFYGSTKTQNKLDTLVQKLNTTKGALFTEREFNSIRIREISFQKKIFSWTVINDVWVASFTPFLIEDVVRTYETGTSGAFKDQIAAAKQKASQTKEEAGNFYINLQHLSSWLSVFTEDKLPFMMNNLARSTSLDAKVNENTVVFNGFSSDSATQSAYSLSVFSKQLPVPLSLKQFISNRTAMLISYGVSDGAKMEQSIKTFAHAQRAQLNDTLQKLQKDLAIDLSQLVNNVKGEIGISYMESREKKLSKVLMIQTGDVESWLKTMNALSAKLSVDTVFFERFSEYEIRELPLYHFPEKVLWPLVSGFKTSFYTTIGNTLLIAEDIEELKKVLDDIDREETWGKSVNQNQFLETTLLEANLSVYINTPKVWNSMSARLRPEWSEFVQNNKRLLNSLKMCAIQFSHFDESYYTNVSWAYSAYKRRVEKEPAREEKTMTNFSHPLYKSFVVESHVSKSDELLVQDSSYNVSLVSPDGKVLWQIALGQPITGQVHQIDYFKNNKLQYLFATASTLYLIDRLGKSVAPFPIQLKMRDAEHVSVIDYDHSKKYRFLVSGRSGKLWMYDKEGTTLEGWRPNDAQGSLLVAARHHRIKGKDYIVAIRRDGIVYLMNRRGEMYKKFPLNLETRLSGNYFLEIGSSLAHTHFVVVAKDGFKIRFTLEGKVLNRETLVKTSMDAQFSLICDPGRRSYVVARQENKQLAVFTEDGKEILKNDFVGLHPMNVDYYDFGSGNIYYTVTDLQEHLSFIYDNKGNLITTTPLEYNWVGIRPNENDKLDVFGTVRQTLTIQQLP